MKAPKLLSVAMRMALRDEAKAHRSPRYYVDMGDWHRARRDEKCNVCFAGSVMAFSLSADIKKNCGYGSFGDDWAMVFKALDRARKGDVRGALQYMHHLRHREFGLRWIEVADYYNDRTQWRKDMFKLVKELEAKGL